MAKTSHQAIVQRRKVWEGRMRRALKRYFNAERKAILAALDTYPDWQMALVIGVNLHSEKLEKLLDTYYRRIFRDFARDTYQHNAPDFDQTLQEYLARINDAVNEYLPDIATRIVGINEYTISQVQIAVQKAIEEYQTVGEVRDTLQTVIKKSMGDKFRQFNKGRVLTIARTEVGTMSSAGQFESFKQSGAWGSRWNSALTADTRDSHADIHGQVRALGEKFSNGLTRPLQPGAPAGEVINCMCSLGMVFTKPDS